MPLDLKQHLQDEIANEQKKIADLDTQIRAKTGKLLDEKSASVTKVAILKKLISDFDKANKK